MPQSDDRTRVSPSERKRELVYETASREVMEDAEMLADVKAYDAAKARLENGEDELVPLEIIERRLSEEPGAPNLA